MRKLKVQVRMIYNMDGAWDAATPVIPHGLEEVVSTPHQALDSALLTTAEALGRSKDDLEPELVF